MNKKTEQALETIAQKTLLMDTLKTRNTSEDFEEVAVWQVRKALEQAYQLGLKQGQKQ
ncbi:MULTISPECIES: hypothetical protein [unclassified Endozoicomonas]|uniref:DUF6900 domain-containing protein n=1 Tax=unclassified Endozoicomonas TaxID=2644528 RepID=UPI002147A317|nr:MULTISPECIES: hypothetical protein [unclassified Endozoicomonas]WOG28741.1 hypothetical protein P6910_03535 [Endozoicomonas sp. 8E]